MKKIGFAIELYPDDVIEANVEDSFGPGGDAKDRSKALNSGFVTESGQLTEKGSERLTVDAVQMERNVLIWLRKMFESASDHGHATDGSLVGLVSYDPADKTQKELIKLGKEGIDLFDLSYGSDHEFAYKGTSAFSTVLGGRLFLEK